MGAPRTYRTEGIVLRRDNLGEADKILTLVTPDHGKVRALAKAIRRPKSKLSGHLDLFCRSQLLIAKGQALDIVAGAAMIDGYKHVRDDLWLTSCAIYLVELIDRFSEENLENRALYRLLVEALEALDGGRNSELLLRYVELHALELAGFRPQLRRCLVCGREIEPETNRFGPNGVTCAACPIDSTSRPISVAALKVLRFLQANTLPAAMRLNADPRVLGEVEGQLRRAIRTILERELKSSEFLGLVRRQTAEGKIAAPTPT
ncbi:MAG: DNA repair protein RecO [Dehalococcoidia bacterium]|nr:MAG: DNA repair protein RecO [Dehalococcoidia bacterium]